jgi:hypothetical protein
MITYNNQNGILFAYGNSYQLILDVVAQDIRVVNTVCLVLLMRIGPFVAGVSTCTQESAGEYVDDSVIRP